jgi:hypothetical protein
MLNKHEFKEVCRYSYEQLKINKTLSSISNSFLFIIRAHPFILKRYKSIFNQKISIFFFLKIFLKICINIIKVVLFFFISFFKKDIFILKKKSNSYNIIISHITNKGQFLRNIDNQYSGIEKKVDKKRNIFFYINHHQYKFDINNLREIKRNFYITSDSVNINEFRIIIKTIFSNFVFLLEFIKTIKNNKKKIFYLLCITYLVSVSNVRNQLFYYKLKKLIKNNKIKNILTTFEGHPFEYITFYLSNKFKINSYAYQHSLISKYQYSMFLNLGKKFYPTQAFACGKNTFEIMKKKLPFTKVDLLGSLKNFNYHVKSKHNHCIVLPEGFYSETKVLLDLATQYLKYSNNKNVKFIFRLHPELNFSKLIKKYPDLKNLPSQINFSNKKILEDFKKCKYILYRGSTGAVQAIGCGLIPIYYQKNVNEIEFDSLWQLNKKYKYKVKNYNELEKVFNKKIPKENKKNLKKFSQKFYSNIQLKILQKYDKAE